MENLEQFFKNNQRGYPRDPRRMAYNKLQKNTQGMDREQLEAFIKANLFIPHSQYKMALGNLIQFLNKQDQMKKLNEVEKFKKLAGLLKESYPGNDKWYEEFQTAIVAMGLAGEAEARVMKALDRTDPITQYGFMTAPEAARDFVNDLGIDVYPDDYDDYDADYKEPRDDFNMAGGDFYDGEFYEGKESGIVEAGNVKGIKIEIPGNSTAVDFGKAAAREVIESFGPREYRGFLEAFLSEFKKLTGGM